MKSLPMIHCSPSSNSSHLPKFLHYHGNLTLEVCSAVEKLKIQRWQVAARFVVKSSWTLGHDSQWGTLSHLAHEGSRGHLTLKRSHSARTDSLNSATNATKLSSRVAIPQRPLLYSQGNDPKMSPKCFPNSKVSSFPLSNSQGRCWKYFSCHHDHDWWHKTTQNMNSLHFTRFHTYES